MASIKKINLFGGHCQTLLIVFIIMYFSMTFLTNKYPNCPSPIPLPSLVKIPAFQISRSTNEPIPSPPSRTNVSHLVFGLVGSEQAWNHRRSYVESWWKPNVTRGFVFLDKPPSEKLLPWSPSSPPYRISEDLTTFLNKTDVTHQRILNGIAETFNEDHENLRWLVMGDDDSIFFVDNLVDVLAQLDHTKYYYLGGHSEFVLENYRFSFRQGFGGAGIILSYPLAKALAEDMKNCQLRYRVLNAADTVAMSCISDFGVQLTHHRGLHQIDLWGDIWGYLSAHSESPLLSLHHFDSLTPIFPSKDRAGSTHHLMNAARIDQSRVLQQTVCYHRQANWSVSISWGYSAQIYENTLPRSYLKMPMETFNPWVVNSPLPRYMFNTRLPTQDPCLAPHVFFYETIEKMGNEILTIFSRGWDRSLPPCSLTGNHSADSVLRIRVFSRAKKRIGADRSECCDVVRVDGDTAEVKIRECENAEVIA